MANLSNYNGGTGSRLPWFTNEMPILKMRDVVGELLTLQEFGFINTKNGRKCVLAVAEKPGRVIFCNEIMAETFEHIEADGMHAAACDGKTRFTIITRTSESGREYFALVFAEE